MERCLDEPDGIFSIYLKVQTESNSMFGLFCLLTIVMQEKLSIGLKQKTFKT